MNTALKLEYWWVIIPGAILFAWVLSKMSKSSKMKQEAGSGDNAQKVHYSSSGRSGSVHYHSRDGNFDMYYQFGGGDVVVSISIPSPKDWVAITGIPIEQREDVLDFIGQAVVRDQTTGGTGSFKIEGDFINIYS